MQFPCFSRKQQQVLGVCCLLYGLWLVGVAAIDTRTTVESHQLSQPDPPDLTFYLDPPIDVNASTSEELQLLPSIGPVMAQRIIAYREHYGPFTSLDALNNVKGIGPKTIQKFRYYLSFPK